MKIQSLDQSELVFNIKINVYKYASNSLKIVQMIHKQFTEEESYKTNIHAF